MLESGKKSKSGVFATVAVLLGLVILVGIYMMKSQELPSTPTSSVALASNESDAKISEIAPSAGMSEDEAEDATVASEDQAGVATENTTETVEKSAASVASETSLTIPRILGNPEAPVKISEHSSFTCGACAAYHRTNFKEIKKDFIDTGKAYIVFDDFPRNSIDVMIGSLARCIQGDAYFNFVQLLFETQSDWATGDYQQYAIQNAVIAGLTKEKAESCMNDKTVHEALAASRNTAQEKFDVNATPTLIINDKVKISGLTPYEELKKALEDELAKSGQ